MPSTDIVLPLSVCSNLTPERACPKLVAALSAISQESQRAQGVEEVPALVVESVAEDVVAPSRQQQQQQQQQQSAASNGVLALATRFGGDEPRKGAAVKVASESSPEPAAMVSTKTTAAAAAAAVSPPGSVGLKPATVTAKGVGASYMARIRNGASDWHNKNGIDNGAGDPASTTASATAAPATATATASTANGTATRQSPSAPTPSTLVESTIVASISQKPEIAMSGEDEDEDTFASAPDTGGKTSGSYPRAAGKSTPATSLIADGEALAAKGGEAMRAEGQAKSGYGSSVGAAPGAGVAAAAVHGGDGFGKTAAGAAEAPAAEGEGGVGGEEEEDEETREYRRVLLEMLRPVKLEKLVDDFLRSEITLDILPLVSKRFERIYTKV